MLKSVRNMAMLLSVILLSTSLNACCRRPKVTPTTIRTIKVRCLTEPPPTIPDAADQVLRPGEGICPKAATGGCYMLEAAVAIGAQLRYARRAWNKCRPTAADEEPNP